MTTLTMIARDMEMQAQRAGSSIRELRGGLRIELHWYAGQKTLRLSRPAVRPGDEEVSICRYNFGVPADAQRLDGEIHTELRWAS